MARTNCKWNFADFTADYQESPVGELPEVKISIEFPVKHIVLVNATLFNFSEQLVLGTHEIENSID